jgi:hypothetical protein
MPIYSFLSKPASSSDGAGILRLKAVEVVRRLKRGKVDIVRGSAAEIDRV